MTYTIIDFHTQSWDTGVNEHSKYRNIFWEFCLDSNNPLIDVD